MDYIEILFWKVAIRLIKCGYGGNCPTKDLEDFEDTVVFKGFDTLENGKRIRDWRCTFDQGRCPSCRAKEIIDWIERHIGLIEN